MSEDRARLKQELDKVRSSLEQNIERSMSLEKDNVLLQARVETLLSQQEEMTALKRERKSLIDDMSKLKEDLAEVNVINKDLSVQRDRAQEDFSVIKGQLEAERKELLDFKAERDRDFLRLRKLVDDERDEVRQKFDHLQEDYRRKYQDREEMKIRCKQNVALVEKLQSKIKNLEAKVQELEKVEAESVSSKVHKDLKKHYKELKRKYEILNASQKVTDTSGQIQTRFKQIH